MAPFFQRYLNGGDEIIERGSSLRWSAVRYDWLRSMVMRDKLFAVVVKISGRSAAWLARLVRDQEVGGSNPLAPTILFNDLSVPSGI